MLGAGVVEEVVEGKALQPIVAWNNMHTLHNGRMNENASRLTSLMDALDRLQLTSRCTLLDPVEPWYTALRAGVFLNPVGQVHQSAAGARFAFRSPRAGLLLIPTAGH